MSSYVLSILLFVFFVLTSMAYPQSREIQPRSILSGHRKTIEAIAFSPDGRRLATGSDESIARLWDVSTAGLLATLPGHDKAVGRLSFSPDGRILESGRTNNTVWLWAVRTGELKTTLTELRGSIFSVAFSPDSRAVATASLYDLSAHIWDAETGRLRATLTHPKPYPYANGVDAVAFTPDGKTLITASARTIYLWNVATAQIKSKLIDSDVRIYDGFKKLEGFSHGDTIYELVISPDGHTLASVSRDNTAKLWGLESGKLKATLQHEGKVLHVAFSRDSTTLATGSEDKTARLWNVSSSKLIATLRHQGTVQSLSFSADSAIIATASDNEKAVNLWRVATGEKLAELPEARPPLAFSPIGRILATASRGNDLLLWDISLK